MIFLAIEVHRSGRVSSDPSLHLGHAYFLHQHLLLHQQLVVAIEAGVRNVRTEKVVIKQVLVVAR